MTWTLSNHVTFTEVTTPPPQVDLWYWVKPDPLLPKYHHYYPVRSVAPNPCVFLLGEVENADNSPPCRFDEPWQWFAADVMALAGFGKHYNELNAAERAAVSQCFTGTFASDVAFNNRTGVDRYNNYITNEMRGEEPRWDKARRCGTDSVRGEIVTNSKGQKMIKVQSFDFWSGPPADYGLEILDDPRIGYATIIGTGGAVYNFPPRGLLLYTSIPFPLVAYSDLYYPLEYCSSYTGERRPIGYKPGVMGAVYNVARWMLAKAGLR